MAHDYAQIAEAVCVAGAYNWSYAY